MLVMSFDRSDLARLRFAISPLVELHRSLRALDDPGAQALHLPWIVATRERVADLDDELGAMLATPPEDVRRELRRAYRHGLPELLEPFLDDPAAAVGGLAELLRRYWRRALAPHWDRLRSLLEGDVLYRARRLADSGADGLFADMHPELSFADGELRVEKPFEATIALGGRGLVCV